MSENFDTLAETNRLKAAGVTPPHAEAYVNVVVNSRNGLATEASLTSLLRETNAGIKGLNDRMDGMNDRIDGMNDRIDGMNASIVGTNARIDGTNARIDGTNDRIDATNDRIDATNETVKGQGKVIDTLRWAVGLNFAITISILVVILTRTF